MEKPMSPILQDRNQTTLEGNQLLGGGNGCANFEARHLPFHQTLEWSGFGTSNDWDLPHAVAVQNCESPAPLCP